MKENKNAGFTLIELMVVVAIIGVLAGAYMASLSMNTEANLREDALALDHMLSRCRVEQMSGADAVVTLLQNWSTKEYTATLRVNGEKIETVVFDDTENMVFKEGETEKHPALLGVTGTGFPMSFLPGTGAMAYTVGGRTQELALTEIVFQSGTADYRIELHPLTGYFETKA